MWLFIRSLIANPAFDSQAKNTLTTPAKQFGSVCKLTDDFLKKGKQIKHKINKNNINKHT